MRVRIDSQRIRLNHRAAVHLRISAWRAKFTSARGALPYGQHQVTVSAVDHFVSDQPCKLQGVDHAHAAAAARHARNLRETLQCSAADPDFGDRRSPRCADAGPG